MLEKSGCYLRISSKSFSDYHKLVRDNFEQGTFFRGVKDHEKHALVPSIGRYCNRVFGNHADFIEAEKSALVLFGMECQAYTDYIPRGRWELLVLAHITRRITAQSGVITVHHKPWEAFEPDEVTKIKIVASARDEIKDVLLSYNIHRKTLFHDLDGLCSWIRTMKFTERY